MLKSDQNGIEITAKGKYKYYLNRLKSDQNGIEIGDSLHPEDFNVG